MNAFAIRNSESQSTISEEARTHITILTELLRDVDLEKRMMTLIKCEDFLQEEEKNDVILQSIRVDLEEELQKIRQMLFTIEQAQYLMNC